MSNLENLAIKMGVDINTLPDRLISTYLKAILAKMGGSVEALPNNLYSTILGEIINVAGNGAAVEIFNPETDIEVVI